MSTPKLPEFEWEKIDRLTTERDALKADNERLREALTLVLPRLAHKGNCGSFNPTSEWAEKGSINFDNCSCEISIVQAALAEGKGGRDAS